jgi:hypothetical protein
MVVNISGSVKEIGRTSHEARAATHSVLYMFLFLHISSPNIEFRSCINRVNLPDSWLLMKKLRIAVTYGVHDVTS